MIVSASVLAFLATFVGPAGAQESKSARGTVTAIAGDSVTVKAGTQELKFTVDAKTTVVVEGGGTADRAAAAKGTGPKLAELLKVGEAVEVSYRESAGVLLATSVRRVSSAGASGGGTSDQKAAEKSETASGNVTDVTQTSLTIAGSGSGGTKFTQTYTIDANTKVVGEGVGTAASKGKVTITDLVKKGDPVTVTYTASGSTVRATEVRVRRPQ
jgi:hypothetical protein